MNLRDLSESDAIELCHNFSLPFICVIGYDHYKIDDTNVKAEIICYSTNNGDAEDVTIKLTSNSTHSIHSDNGTGVGTPYSIDVAWVSDFLLIRGYE